MSQYSLCEFICESVFSLIVSGRRCLLGVIYLLWLLQSFHLLSLVAPWSPEWRGLMKTFHVGLSTLKSLHTVQLWISVLIPIFLEEKLLWCGLNDCSGSRLLFFYCISFSLGNYPLLLHVILESGVIHSILLGLGSKVLHGTARVGASLGIPVSCVATYWFKGRVIMLSQELY